jgi:hypothetical protein
MEERTPETSTLALMDLLIKVEIRMIQGLREEIHMIDV